MKMISEKRKGEAKNMQKREKSQKKVAKLTAAVALSMAIAGTSIPVSGMDVKAEDTSAAQANMIIPKPLEYDADADGGTFSLEADSEIYVSGDPEVTEIAEYLQEEFGKSTGYELPVSEGSDTSAGDILLAADGDESLGEEGYTVTVGENGVKVSAYTPHGIFNGVQTLRQLFPADIESTDVVADVEWTASYCEIYDKPEYSYRGAMIDSARHFHSVESVKRQIDHMAKYKINKLHLRLADDQGWRLEIKGETETGESYDKLRTIGASTSCSTNGYRPGQYTQEEFRELAEYAADHYVEIIPEFDMPGHSWAALVSLEYLNSTEDGKPHSGNYDNTKPYDGWDVGFSTLECRNENTYKFIEDVISQVAPLYPSEYIHIGGDEAHSTSAEDYTYFMNRVTEIAQKYGKTPIGWQNYDTVVESTVEDKDNTVTQYWLTDGAKYKEGVKYMVSPANYAYMDMIYDSSCPYGLQWAGPNPIDDAYNWDPTNYLPEGGTKDQIIGIEAPLFGETIATDEAMDYMMYPRLMGHAEIGWTPKENRDWNEYKTRMIAHGERLRNQGIGFFEDENYWEKPVVPLSTAWSMDEGEGTQIMDAGQEYAGTLHSDVQWTEGKYGTALKFNNGYVDLDVGDINKKWTIAMWVNREDNPATNSTLICGAEGEIKLEQYNDTNKVGLTQFGVVDETFDYEAPVGEWVHLAFVSDGSATSLYVNGTLTDTIDLVITAPADRIGANTKGGLADSGALKGTVDELKIVNRVLSAEEVAELSDEGTVPMDTSLLEAALDTASKVNLDGYVSEGKDAFEAAKAAAETLLANGAQTQAEINSACANLDNARLALKLKADKSQLAIQIQNAEAALNTEGQYTEASLAELQAVYDQYISVWENDELSTDDQDLVTEAKEALEAALANLVEAGEEPEPVSKSILERYLNDAKDWVEKGEVDSCVESIRKLFDEAIAEGEAVMADADATRDEVVDAARKLMLAINALNMKAADKTDLSMAVEIAGMIDLDRYVEAGQQEFRDALAIAEETLADGDTMQPGADQAWSALVDAMGDLRLKAEKDVLEDLINEAEGLDLAQYTEESAAAFRTALASAQAVFADQTLSVDDQQTVDDAVASLRMAREGLTVKADGTEGEEQGGAEDSQKPDDGNQSGTDDSQKPEGGNNGGNGNAGNSGNTGNADNGGSVNNTQKAAKTGDAAHVGMLVAVMLMSGLVILKMRRGRA